MNSRVFRNPCPLSRRKVEVRHGYLPQYPPKKNGYDYLLHFLDCIVLSIAMTMHSILVMTDTGDFWEVAGTYVC
jgi:hypothetical protein